MGEPGSEYDTERWLPTFRDVTPRSVVVPAARAFLEYLLEDGVYAPSFHVQSRMDSLEEDDGGEEDVEKASDDEAPRDAVDGAPTTTKRGGGYRSFPQLEAQLSEGINALGGAVAPKIGTKSPVDCTWINFHTHTKCETSDDVILLLKSSTRVAEEVEDRLQRNLQSSIVLRKWSNLHAEREYRVFVRDDKVLAISQRDEQTCSKLSDDEKSEVRRVIVDFVASRLNGNFPRRSYVADVYVDTKMRVWLLDFAPYGRSTHSALFEWEEIDASSNETLFRVLDDDTLRPARMLYDGLPYELQGEHGMASLVEAAQKLVREQERGEEAP